MYTPYILFFIFLLFVKRRSSAIVEQLQLFYVINKMAYARKFKTKTEQFLISRSWNFNL